MRFKFKLWGTGWATGSFSHGADRVEFSISYMHDFLGDLSEAVLELLTDEPTCDVTDMDTGETRVEFSSRTIEWEDEPGRWRLDLALIDDDCVEVAVKHDPRGGDTSWRDLAPVFKHEVPLLTLAKAILKALEETLKKHGLVGYKKTWDRHEFPIGRLLVLKEAVAAPDPRAMFDDDASMYRSNLATEARAIRTIASP